MSKEAISVLVSVCLLLIGAIIEDLAIAQVTGRALMTVGVAGVLVGPLTVSL
jgi:hypothetical protein